MTSKIVLNDRPNEDCFAAAPCCYLFAAAALLCGGLCLRKFSNCHEIFRPLDEGTYGAYHYIATDPIDSTKTRDQILAIKLTRELHLKTRLIFLIIISARFRKLQWIKIPWSKPWYASLQQVVPLWSYIDRSIAGMVAKPPVLVKQGSFQMKSAFGFALKYSNCCLPPFLNLQLNLNSLAQEPKTSLCLV